MSTSSRIASMPAATWAISRSSGPRTAATMQNSVAPVLAVCLAASTRLGMSSQALRTGEAKSPDCEQKWQSSGQPPVFRLMMPSTSTSGPHQRIRTSWARASSSSSRSSGSCSTSQHLLLAQSLTALEHLLTGHGPGCRCCRCRGLAESPPESPATPYVFEPRPRRLRARGTELPRAHHGLR